MTKHSKQYLNKREYLGFRKAAYWLKYGPKIVIVNMIWKAREYEIISAHLTSSGIGLKVFPYRKTPKVIDRIEELLK